MAQVIRRFRSLDMPLDEIQAVFAAVRPRSRQEMKRWIASLALS
jgi:DNA-binding transcriptional MerR regulator